MEFGKYKVCVLCLTYNQSAYIIDTLNGFCMQETTFPFVCTIIDDASTDGEQEVIKKYLQQNFDLNDETIVRNEETDDYVLTFARNKTNMNCFFAVLYLKYNHYRIAKDKFPYILEWLDNVKYNATCEGDDYWIDPHKLQKQVDFLENHPDYVLCCHETRRYYQDTGEMSYQKHQILNKYPNGYSFECSYDPWLTQTLTNVYRANFKGKDIYLSMKRRYDVIFAYFIRKSGLCFLMPDVMSVYRIHRGGICSGTPFVIFYRNILDAFIELNQKDDSSEAKEVLLRHVNVNIGDLLLLHEWKMIIQSIKDVKEFVSFGEFVRFLFTLPIYGFHKILKITLCIVKNKVKKGQ